MPADLDPVALAQPLLGDRAGGDADRRLAGGGAAAAAQVAQSVFLPVGIVGVAGPERVGERAVVLAALILVADQKADRRAGRPAFEHTGQNLDAVGLLALRHVAGAAGLAPVEVPLNIAFGELEPGRTAVHDSAVSGSVALAERGHAVEQTESVA